MPRGTYNQLKNRFRPNTMHFLNISKRIFYSFECFTKDFRLPCQKSIASVEKYFFKIPKKTYPYFICIISILATDTHNYHYFSNIEGRHLAKNEAATLIECQSCHSTPVDPDICNVLKYICDSDFDDIAPTFPGCLLS